MSTTLECRRPSPAGKSCIEALADGWIGAPDLCPACTRAFMDALDSISGPLVWHKNYTARADR